MNVSVGSRWEEFVEAVVKEGRYGSASEVVREGLRLVEERETKLRNLRQNLQAAIDEDVWYTPDEVIEHIQHELHEDDADFAPKP